MTEPVLLSITGNPASAAYQLLDPINVDPETRKFDTWNNDHLMPMDLYAVLFLVHRGSQAVRTQFVQPTLQITSDLAENEPGEHHHSINL